MKEDVKINDKRITFSKKVKRKVLLELVKGSNPTQALLKHTSLSLDEITSDKKYAAKLIHKWKQEYYKNREILFILNHELDEEMIDEEIANLTMEEEVEEFNIDNAVEEIERDFLKIKREKQPKDEY